MNSIFSEAAALCAKGIPFVWATIISQDGSTPRSSGSKMLVLADSIVATIGGGGMEASVIREARDYVLKDWKPRILRYDMSASGSADADLICGGVCEVLLAGIEPAMQNVFEAAAEAETVGIPAWLFYVLDTRPDSALPFQLCANVNCERVVGSFRGSTKVVRDMLKNPIRLAIHGDGDENLRYIVEDVSSAPRMYLFGAGHVSCEVAKLALTVGFNVTVVDDRADFCNPDRFPDCDCIVIDSFEQMPDFPVDGNSYVIIMTRGHAYDKEVLRWALGKPHFYLGMIGSKTKRDKLYQALMEEGTAAETLVAVHCPIGLSIFAETPAEIAVSVIAEIIAERRKER